jgi:hypothetical protein
MNAVLVSLDAGGGRRWRAHLLLKCTWWDEKLPSSILYYDCIKYCDLRNMRTDRLRVDQLFSYVHVDDACLVRISHSAPEGM